MNRRAFDRFPVWFPVHVDAEDLGSCGGLCRDVSVDGINLASRDRYAVGAPVRVGFRLMPISTEARWIPGTVVRAAENTESLEWPHLLAVEFDEPVPELEPLFAQLR